MKYSAIPFYRTQIRTQLKAFRVVYKESDLYLLAEKDLTSETTEILVKVRKPLEEYVFKNKKFLESKTPIAVKDAPGIVKKMALAGKIAGVGPMASVAGAIAQEVGEKLIEKKLTSQVVVENGGDVFLNLKKDARVIIFAGDSPFSGKIGIVIKKEIMPCGVCTSSGKIGHSLSFGRADAVTVVHKDTAIADALATSFGNMIFSSKDFKRIIKKVKKIKNLLGVVVIIEDKVLIYGKEIKLDILPQDNRIVSILKEKVRK
jgi:ApbE superfamily uncharacterized protein (UPF0280 family)